MSIEVEKYRSIVRNMRMISPRERREDRRVWREERTEHRRERED